jgi:hypothetical protein
MHGPTCIFWANLLVRLVTTFSLKAATDGAAFKALAAKSVAGYAARWYDSKTGAFDSAKGSGATSHGR